VGPIVAGRRAPVKEYKFVKAGYKRVTRTSNHLLCKQREQPYKNPVRRSSSEEGEVFNNVVSCCLSPLAILYVDRMKTVATIKRAIKGDCNDSLGPIILVSLLSQTSRRFFFGSDDTIHLWRFSDITERNIASEKLKCQVRYIYLHRECF